jgi:imidazolonepropionase-like amidohydrolase
MTFRAGIAALVLASAAVVGACSSAGSRADSVVIRDVTVIPMTDVDSIPSQTVVVSGGRIVAMGPDGEVAVPRGATEVDGRGRYLIPGLFDIHSHLSKIRASALGLYVVHGVTTLRDQGSEPDEVLRWRREVRAGERVGPRMLLAGPYLESLRNIERMRADPPESRVEPFERARTPVGSPADARRIVDSLAALGFDHLKIRTVQDEETYLALNAAADARGIRLVGHMVVDSPELLLRAGQDGVEHGFPASLDSLPRERRMAFWRQLAARDIGVVPTLVVVTESGFRSPEYFRTLIEDTTAHVHPLRDHLSAYLILDWREQAAEATPERRAYFEQVWPASLRHVREMSEAGVRIMTGSDVGVLNVFPGESLHEEMRLFVDSAGMTPLRALASATREPAEWLGMADSLGTVEPGKVADLVLLDASPLDAISNTRRIAAVLVRGRLFDREGLDAQLAAVRAAPDRRQNDWVR